MQPRPYSYRDTPPAEPVPPNPLPSFYTPRKERYGIHILLFVLTLIASVYAGFVLVGRAELYERAGWTVMVLDGFLYAIPLLLFLSVHEFGHYFAARYHRISTTLPYYIPSPLPLLPVEMFNIGTFGAVIRIREAIPSTRKLFDVGVAGPLAGFVVALGILLYALGTLPPLTYLNDLGGHVQLKEFIADGRALPETWPVPYTIYVGQTPLYWVLTQFFEHVPPMYEMYHYPVLFAGWLALFFTALNLMPIGQLDGGHILYALVGPKWHSRLARGFVLLLLLSAGIGFSSTVSPSLMYSMGRWGLALTWLALVGILYLFLRKVFAEQPRLVMPALFGLLALVLIAEWMGPSVTQYGYLGWFFWCVLIVAFIKIDHPPVLYHEPLTPVRRALGILSMVIFVLCFSIRPLYVLDPAMVQELTPAKPIAGAHIEGPSHAPSHP